MNVLRWINVPEFFINIPTTGRYLYFFIYLPNALLFLEFATQTVISSWP